MKERALEEGSVVKDRGEVVLHVHDQTRHT
jgi:hypothetical protein